MPLLFVVGAKHIYRYFDFGIHKHPVCQGVGQCIIRLDEPATPIIPDYFHQRFGHIVESLRLVPKAAKIPCLATGFS